MGSNTDTLSTTLTREQLAEELARRKLAEEALRRRVEEMSVLSRVGRQVTASLAMNDVVQAALDGIAAAVAPDLGLLYLLEGSTLRLQRLWSAADGIGREERQVAECLCRMAAQDRRVIYTADISADPLCTACTDAAIGVRSFAALPLYGGQGIVGVLGLGSAEERSFEEQSSFLEALASQVAIGIQNALLYAKLEATLKALPDILLEVDRSGRVTSLHVPDPAPPNAPQGSIVGKHLAEVMNEEAAGTVMHGIEEAARTGRHLGATFSLEHPQGQQWYELSISAKGETRGDEAALVLLARSITDRRRTEADRALLSSALEQASDMVVITDTNAAVLYVNPAFERGTGYSSERVIGRNPRILKSGNHDTRFYRELWQTLLAGEVWRGHFVNRRADGTLYEEDAAIYPICNESRQITNFVAIKRDVTEEVFLQKRSQQTRKMEALGQLASGVAHDFNNLLMVIQGNLDLMRMSAGHDDRHTEPLSIIARATRSAAQLTRALLAFSRQQVMSLKPLHLDEMIADVLPMLRRLLPDSITVVHQPGPQLDLIDGDRTQLEQVLLNLCSNAADAMPEGGTITIETGNRIIDEHYLRDHPWAHEGRYVFLSVADDGIGMDEETRQRVLDPFFTTKEQGKGTGLGLSSVYGTVKQHRGMIDVLSVPGAGTTVVSYLPVTEAEREAPEHSSTPEAAIPSSGGEVILVVEDLPDLRTVLAALLESEGYRVRTASNGLEGFEILCSEEVQLVITDVTMPKMGGAELYRRSREILPDLCFLFCSGNVSEWQEMGCNDDSKVAYLDKPFDLDQLAAVVRQILTRK